jgi:hypothetical protein
MPPEPSPPDLAFSELVARVVGRGDRAYLASGNRCEQLCSWVFDAFSRIYWLHDPANPNADRDVVPAGCVRIATLTGTWVDVDTHGHVIQIGMCAIDALSPLTPVNGRAPVPESGDFVVYVQMTDRSRVVLSDSLVMPRDPSVLFGTAWEQMCAQFPEDDQRRVTTAPVLTGTLDMSVGAPGVCSAPGCTDKGTLRCTGCSMAWFCSRACQGRSWPAHKESCKRVSAAREAVGTAGGGASGS